MLQASQSKREILLQYLSDKKVVGKPDDIGVNGENLNSFMDEEGNTLLHLAVKISYVKMIKAIFKQMSSNGQKITIKSLPKNNEELTPLQIAVIKNEFEIQYCFAQYLFKNKYPEIFAYITKAHKDWITDGRYPALLDLLKEAINDIEKAKLFKEILKTAPLYLNTKTDTGANILLFSMVYAKDVFEDILNCSYLAPELINSQPNATLNMSCALIASAMRNFDAVGLIINHKHFDTNTINNLDSNGFPMLLHCIHSNDITLIEKLCNYGVHININMKNLFPPSSLLLFSTFNEYYVKETQFKIIDYLIQRGGKFIIEEGNSLQNQIFNAAFYNDKISLSNLLQEIPNQYSTFLSFQNMVNTLNNALLLALRNDNFSMIDTIKFRIGKLLESNLDRLQLLFNINAIKKRIITAKQQADAELKAKILQSIADAFIDESIYIKALNKIEELLISSIPINLKKELQQTTYSTLEYMALKVPYKIENSSKIKLNNIFNKTIYAILQKHGFDTNKIHYFFGFIDNKKADEIAKDSLFQESISYTSLFHGTRSHILQFAIICILIDLKLIDTKGYNANKIVHLIIDDSDKFECHHVYNGLPEDPCIQSKYDGSLWSFMLDTFSWYQRGGCYISSPHLMNINIMNSADKWPILSHIISRAFIRKLDFLCEKVNNNCNGQLCNGQLTSEQAICSMIASKNEFGICKFKITASDIKQYYESKRNLNCLSQDCDTIVEFHEETANAHIITKSSFSFTEAVTEQCKLYEATINIM